MSAGPAQAGALGSGRRWVTGWTLVFPPILAVLLVMVLLPIGWLFAAAFRDDMTGAWTLSNFVDVFTQKALLEPILRSIVVALFVALLSMTMGGTVAWLTTRADVFGRRLVSVLMVATFVTPSFLGAAGWILLASPNSGWMNKALEDLLGVSPFNIFSMPGLVFVMALYSTPYTYTVVSSTLESMPNSFEDAAKTLGTRSRTVLTRITFPLVLPALMSGFLLSMLEGLTLFGTPALLAMPAGHHLITTQIYQFFQAYPPEYGLAAAYGLPLIAFMAITVLVQRRLLGRRRFTLVTGKAGRARRTELKAWRAPLTVVAFTPGVLAVVLPYAAMIIVSLSPAWGGRIEWSKLTLSSYREALSFGSPLYGVLRNTLVYCSIAALFAIVVAGLTAYVVARSESRAMRGLGIIANLPYIVPGIVLAAGFVAAYSEPPLLLYGTAAILVVAFATRFLPIAYQNSHSLVGSIDPSLEHAARGLGAGRLTTLRLVTVPLARRGLLAAWILTFLAAARELSTAVFLVTPDTDVASTYLYSLANGGKYETVATVGVITVVFTITIVTVADRLVGNTRAFGKEAAK
ncbi:ABC transporter permease [Spirillospora sp. CA-255316]